MPDETSNLLPESFKEAVCIDAGRIYDSCCDRDCLEDLRCYFCPQAQSIVDAATSVRVRTAEVAKVYIDVEPVNFNRGYYSCDLTFFFVVDFELFSAPHTKSECVKGVATFNKKVILYGSEGNVKIFSNETTLEDEVDRPGRPTTNMPKCVVQCVDPIVLSARLGEVKNSYDCCCLIPKCICESIGGNIVSECQSGTAIFVTIGLFSIVQLIRNVQMLVPVYDFCIPEKRCDDSTDHPCDIFKRIKFPTDDFFPPKACKKDDDDGGCGCS